MNHKDSDEVQAEVFYTSLVVSPLIPIGEYKNWCKDKVKNLLQQERRRLKLEIEKILDQSIYAENLIDPILDLLNEDTQ